MVDWNYFTHYFRHKKKEEYLGEKIEKNILRDMMLMIKNEKYNFLNVDLDIELELEKLDIYMNRIKNH